MEQIYKGINDQISNQVNPKIKILTSYKVRLPVWRQTDIPIVRHICDELNNEIERIK